MKNTVQNFFNDLEDGLNSSREIFMGLDGDFHRQNISTKSESIIDPEIYSTLIFPP